MAILAGQLPGWIIGFVQGLACYCAIRRLIAYDRRRKRNHNDRAGLRQAALKHSKEDY
ncbi:MAG: hypothetical protein IPK75_20370 [Acidobacteria bacterium]|nr:hypothetical protein [Acidobacteriota bacterium]